MSLKIIPVLRIFDYAKMKEFYVDWLGFTIDWEHTFGENSPVYLQVSREHIVFHLSEHHGDCCPGGKVFIEYRGIRDLHKEIAEKHYKYYNPCVEEAFWNAWCMSVTDPFGNTLLFSESKEGSL